MDDDAMNWFREVVLDALRPMNLVAYNSIWRFLRKESGYRQRFSNLGSPAMYGWPWDIARVGNWRKFVITLDGQENIGVAAIALDRPNAVCCIELGLLPRFRGQGFGGTAGRLLIRKCFVEFAARRVESTALSTNPASINMRDWMRHEATLKARFLIDGQEVDELMYKIMRPEWEMIEQRLVVPENTFMGINHNF
jgi:RimJ/RimL family protein N-acetyltransferase